MIKLAYAQTYHFLNAYPLEFLNTNFVMPMKKQEENPFFCFIAALEKSALRKLLCFALRKNNV